MADIFDEPRELVRSEIQELKESGYDVEEAERLFSQYLWLKRHFDVPEFAFERNINIVEPIILLKSSFLR